MGALTENEILTLLAVEHAPPDWSFFTHVADGTGANKSRTLDAVAMSMWPSRGLAIHGFEVKSSRSDWLRELKAPAKADPFFRWCDHFWLVTADADVAKVDELPVGWGLKTIKDEVVKTVIKAPQLAPEPATRQMLAALARSVSKGAEVAAGTIVGREVEKVRQRYEKASEERSAKVAELQTKLSNAHRDIFAAEYLQASVREFEAATGIDLASIRGRTGMGTRLGKIVKAVLAAQAMEEKLASLYVATATLQEAIETASDVAHGFHSTLSADSENK